jgi:LmbE family N-acetylglucosaminyl deacetylase
MIIGSIAIVLCVMFGIPAMLNHFVNDRTVPSVCTLIEEGKPNKLMVLFSHPDDEVTVAGTLIMLKHHIPDLELGLVYLTRGEAGPTGGLVTKEELGAARTAEIKQVARLLQADYLELLDLGDGLLKDQDKQDVKTLLRQMIGKYKPSSVITFDSQVGLYGHMDHVLTGLWALEVFTEDQNNPDFSLTRLYNTTLSKPMLELALRFSQTFRDRYPKDPELGLPTATVAVKIASAAAIKGAVVRAHKTQWQVMRDIQPFYDKLPPWLYYLIFDREYLALAAQKE